MNKKDEPIDGAKLAAQILSKMRQPNRERVMQQMAARDPAIVATIQTNLLTFDEIAELTPQGIQLLIQEVAPKDLVLSLKRATKPVSEAIYNNVSDRKRQALKDEVSALPSTPASEIEAAERRIVETLDALRKAGRIRSQSKNDLWV